MKVMKGSPTLYNLTRTTEGPRAWDGDILWTMTSSGHFFQNGQIFVDILKE